MSNVSMIDGHIDEPKGLTDNIGGKQMKTCGQCKHFIGAGDWNLCCSISHPTPKEKERGLDFYWGHLCYEDTKACDMFEEGKNGKIY